MTVSGKQAVEVFMTLDTTKEISSSFLILDHRGKKVQETEIPKVVVQND